MKKMLYGAMTLLFLSGAVMAQDKKGKDHACCTKSDSTGKKACCKQPSKTANLRVKATKPTTRK